MFLITARCFKCNQSNSFIALSQAECNCLCISCKSHLATIQPIKGFVYILSNESMPGLLKIGMTTRSVEDRVVELSSATGVPSEYIIEAYYASTQPDEDEKTIHQGLSSYRFNKEFFRCAAEMAKSIMQSILLGPAWEKFRSELLLSCSAI